MDVKNTSNGMLLFDVVTKDMLYAWSRFLSDVKAEGWTRAMLRLESEKYASKNDLLRVASKFI